MTVRTAERRQNTRSSAAYCAILRDHRNRAELGRGRTADISEGGVYVLVRSNSKIPEHGNLCVSLTVPADPTAGTMRASGLSVQNHSPPRHGKHAGPGPGVPEQARLKQAFWPHQITPIQKARFIAF